MQCVDLGGRRIIKKTQPSTSTLRARRSGRDHRCGSIAFFQAEDGIRDVERSRGLGDVYKRQGAHEVLDVVEVDALEVGTPMRHRLLVEGAQLSLIHI